MAFKSAFISIIGAPNAGKSTLFNDLLKQKLAITTPKAQTTRHRIRAFLNGENYQLILSDTPGIIDPKYALQQHMMSAVQQSLEDADLVVWVMDVTNLPDEEQFNTVFAQISAPLIVVANKIDLLEKPEEWKTAIGDNLPVDKLEQIIGVSALHGLFTHDIVRAMVDAAPEHPPFFDQDLLTDRNVRFFVSEIIRESMLELFKKEIPYSVEVHIEEYKEEKDIDKISAYIFTERDSQKAIILGKGGQAIKRLGISARQGIEKFVGKKVFLSLSVKVLKDWRKDAKSLRRFGYKSLEE